MKLGKVVSPLFHGALMKLSNQDLPIKSAKKVLTSLRLTKDATDRYNKERIELLTALSEKNKKGEVKVDKDGNFSIIGDEAKKKANDGLVALMNQDVLFEKISVDDLGDAKMTAQELSLLEDLLS